MPSDNQPHRTIKYFGFLNRSEKGVTLVELLITFAILGFIIASIYTFYLAGLQSWNRSIDHMEYQQSARIAMNKMINEIRYAHEVEILDGNHEAIYFKVNYKGSSTRFRFRLSGRQLLFEQLKENYSIYAYNVVALGIKSLNFSVDENGTVSVTIIAGDGSKEIALSSSVQPKNIPGQEVENYAH